MRSPKFGDTSFTKYSNTNYLLNEVSYLTIEWKIIDFVKNFFPLPSTNLGFVIGPVKRLLVMWLQSRVLWFHCLHIQKVEMHGWIEIQNTFSQSLIWVHNATFYLLLKFVFLKMPFLSKGWHFNSNDHFRFTVYQGINISKFCVCKIKISKEMDCFFFNLTQN